MPRKRYLASAEIVEKFAIAILDSFQGKSSRCRIGKCVEYDIYRIQQKCFAFVVRADQHNICLFSPTIFQTCVNTLEKWVGDTLLLRNISSAHCNQRPPHWPTHSPAVRVLLLLANVAFAIIISQVVLMIWSMILIRFFCSS